MLTKVGNTGAEHKEILNKEIRNIGERLESTIREKQTLTQLRKSQKSSLILEYQSNIKKLRLMPSRRMRSFPVYRPGFLTCDGFGYLDIPERFTIPSYQIRCHIEDTESYLLICKMPISVDINLTWHLATFSLPLLIYTCVHF